MNSTRLLLSILFILLNFHISPALPLTKFQKWEEPGYFRGFNISEWNNLEDRQATQEEFDDLKAFGANLAVIQTQGTLSDSFPYSPHIYYADETDTLYWQDVLDTLVTYARNTGIPYVIAVRTGPGRRDVGDDELGPSTIWTDTTEQQLYGKMLKDMAQRYLPDSLFVGYDLTVEPNPLDSITGELVETLDSALVASNIDVNAIYTIWIDSVRTIAPDLPLMVEGVHWSNPVYFPLIQKQHDDKIVYKVHCYNPHDFSHAETPFSETYPGVFWSISRQDDAIFNLSFLSDVVYAPVRTFQLAHNVPVMIGEFGLQHPQDGGEQYVTDITDIACGYGWHFAYWNWNNTATFNYLHFDQTYGTSYATTIGNSLTEPCVTGIGDDVTGSVDPELPKTIKLHQNYPNPFNPSTTISFDLPGSSGHELQVNLSIFDLHGRLVRRLIHSAMKSGRQRIVWDGRDERGRPVASGVYLYSLKREDQTFTRKMVVRK